MKRGFCFTLQTSTLVISLFPNIRYWYIYLEESIWWMLLVVLVLVFWMLVLVVLELASAKFPLIYQPELAIRALMSMHLGFMGWYIEYFIIIIWSSLQSACKQFNDIFCITFWFIYFIIHAKRLFYILLLNDVFPFDILSAPTLPASSFQLPATIIKCFTHIHICIYTPVYMYILQCPNIQITKIINECRVGVNMQEYKEIKHIYQS